MYELQRVIVLFDISMSILQYKSQVLGGLLPQQLANQAVAGALN